MTVSIRDRRTELGLTQFSAAWQAGISLPVWNRIEVGRSVHRPRRSTLGAMERALGLPQGTLVAMYYPCAVVGAVRCTTAAGDAA